MLGYPASCTPTHGWPASRRSTTMLGFSRDGFHWHRPFREAVSPCRTSPIREHGNVQSVGGGCLIVGDALRVRDRATRRGVDRLASSPRRFRLDGGRPTGGHAHHPPVRFSGRRLFVTLRSPRENCGPRSWIARARHAVYGDNRAGSRRQDPAGRTLKAMRPVELSGKPVQLSPPSQRAIYAFC